MSSESSAKSGSLEQSVAKLEKRMQQQVAGMRRANRMFMIVGIVVAAVIWLYLQYITNRLASYIMEPATMASFVRTSIESRLPEVFANLEQSLKDGAPDAVAEARKGLMEQLPESRKQVQDMLVKRLTNEIVTVLQAELDEAVKSMIREDKEKLEPLIMKASAPDGAEELTKEFTKLFAEGVGEPLKEKLDEDYNKQLTDMLDYLKRLRRSRDLTPKEEYEKERITEFMIMLSDLLSEAAEDPLGVDKKPAKSEKAAPKGAGSGMK